MSIDNKISWFLKMVTGNELNHDLAVEIKRLFEIRNRIIHYKADPFSPEEIVDHRLREKSKDILFDIKLDEVEYYLEIPKLVILWFESMMVKDFPYLNDVNRITDCIINMKQEDLDKFFEANLNKILSQSS